MPHGGLTPPLKAPLPNTLHTRTLAWGSHTASLSEGSAPNSDEIRPQNPEQLLGQIASMGASPCLLCRDSSKIAAWSRALISKSNLKLQKLFFANARRFLGMWMEPAGPTC